MKKRKLKWIFATMAFLALTGCQDTVNTFANEEPLSPEDHLVGDKRFVSDSFCRDRLNLLSLRAEQGAAGNMIVQAELRSERYGVGPEIWSWFRRDNPYHVLYRFEWFDANGMRVANASSEWQSIIFVPGETKYLRGVAPDSRCRDFQLSVVEDHRPR